MLGHGSEPGVRKAVERLVVQGVVLRQEAGRAKLYRLNRQHLAAGHIEGLAHLRADLVGRLSEALDGWEEPPFAAILFGSVPRGEATYRSDVDLLLVRRAAVDEDSPTWLEQLASLEREATEWTGNDARVLEYGENDLADQRVSAVVGEAISDGIGLFGSSRRLRRLIAGGR
jgi:predicted nucleotidyltransferase